MSKTPLKKIIKSKIKTNKELTPQELLRERIKYEIADELGVQKVENLLNTGAQLIASANPGCSLQIKKHLGLKGKDVTLMHPMELLDYSIRGVKLQK